MKLDQYQLDAGEWLLDRSAGILGDEPGVGKSFPAIVAAQRVAKNGPHLLICPAYLIPNWEEMLQQFGETDIVSLTGDRERKLAMLTETHTWTLLSYNLLSKMEYFKAIARRRWQVLLFDEAHRLRGRNSKWTRNAYHVQLRVERTWMLTGTPIVRDPSDLFPLLRLCDRNRYTSYWWFVDMWCLTNWTPWGKVVLGVRDAEAFNDMLKPYMLRRTLANVLPDIPEAVEQVIYVDLPPKLQKAHQAAKKEYVLHHPTEGDRDLTSGGALIVALRRLTAESNVKNLALAELL